MEPPPPEGQPRPPAAPPAPEQAACVTEESRMARLLSRVVQAPRIGAWAVDRAGKVTWAEGAEHLFESPGPLPADLDGLVALFAEGDRQPIRQAFERGLGHAEPFDLDAQAVTARGQPVWLRVVGRPEEKDEGR